MSKPEKATSSGFFYGWVLMTSISTNGICFQKPIRQLFFTSLSSPANVRKRGFSTITEVFAPSMSVMAAPVRSPSGTLGVVTIAGPVVRLTETRMEELANALMTTAYEIQRASGASAMFKKRA